MALLTTQTFPSAVAGAAVTTAAAAVGGDTVAAPGRRRWLHVRNGGGASINVTIAVPGNTFNGVAAPDTVIAVAAGAERLIPISAEYTDPSTGLAAITYSAVTSVTVAYYAIA